MIHHVFANRSNVGDWLSARGIRSLLAPEEVAESLCDGPFVGETLDRLAAATPEDGILIGGGGLFMDYFLPFWEGFAALAGRVPFCIWGVGYCDMKRENSRPPRQLLEHVVRRARVCVVRDELTRGHLGGCALPAAVPCPTVVAVREAPEGKGLLHSDSYDNVGPEVFETMVATAREFAGRTGRTYRATNNLIPAGKEAALASVLDLYAAADLVLTSRLHGCIIGLAMGRKVLAVSGDHKVESFMQAAGLGEWVCGLDDMASLPGRLQALPGQQPAREFIEWARGRNRAVAAKVRAALGVP